ncbi:putative SPIN90/Ldb17 leucine-rich domain-containing protein [Seiridium unicorne]|uniref:SPIN90/Ldb17 leucine-rich domain-containing protein n=1 Tax=Seiridium unicorne TaxID=138068 RepID=A0ABR2UMS1_9PEZI
MADSDTSYTIETEQQLWEEIEQVVATQCAGHAHETIDDALRTWLHLAAKCRTEFSQSEDDVASCSQRLLEGSLFHANQDYVRTQIIYSLLQEDESTPLYVIASFLLLDGRNEDATYRRMIDEGCFHRLLELMNGRNEDDPSLHRLLLELMYEMSRVEKLRPEDLVHVDDGFITYLFQLIEGFSDDVHDPYHYPIIRVLLVLNEQYMVASTTVVANPDSPGAILTNRVVKCLSLYGPIYRTFGENLILLLNRETETALQLLILKLLYLLFTTKATYEYFYTNDLRVLLDVIIRNLLDLPNEYLSLRHTYLRVLYPLLAHTQLNQPPHYKRDEIIKVLNILAGTGSYHFAPPDETTARLVDRVSKVKWLAEDGAGAGEIARKFLGISLDSSDTASKISVVDVAAVTEKPGVQTPSRKADFEAAETASEGVSSPETDAKAFEKKAKAAPPPPRRQRKPLPEIPKHRHGIPVALHVSGNGNGTAVPVKKLPPKAPPPRRMNRLKTSESPPAPAS